MLIKSEIISEIEFKKLTLNRKIELLNKICSNSLSITKYRNYWCVTSYNGLLSVSKYQEYFAQDIKLSNALIGAYKIAVNNSLIKN